MTVQKRRRGAAPVVPVPAATLASIEEGIGRVRDANHARGNREAVEAGVEHAVDRALARLGVGKPAEVKPEVPFWMKLGGRALSITDPSALVVGLIWTMAIAPVVTRLSAQEGRAGELSAALVTVSGRVQASETKLVQMDTQISTATRIRDQQQQGTSDRLRALELSDQAGAQQINALAQSLAGLVARMEEMLRRQERLENRLSGPEPRSGR